MSSGAGTSAAPIHLGRTPRDRLPRVGQRRDSERTDETVVAEEITAQAQLRYRAVRREFGIVPMPS